MSVSGEEKKKLREWPAMSEAQAITEERQKGAFLIAASLIAAIHVSLKLARMVLQRLSSA